MNHSKFHLMLRFEGLIIIYRNLTIHPLNLLELQIFDSLIINLLSLISNAVGIVLKDEKETSSCDVMK